MTPVKPTPCDILNFLKLRRPWTTEFVFFFRCFPRSHRRNSPCLVETANGIYSTPWTAMWTICEATLTAMWTGSQLLPKAVWTSCEATLTAKWTGSQLSQIKFFKRSGLSFSSLYSWCLQLLLPVLCPKSSFTSSLQSWLSSSCPWVCRIFGLAVFLSR